jgi:hypothetical protein
MSHIAGPTSEIKRTRVVGGQGHHDPQMYGSTERQKRRMILHELGAVGLSLHEDGMITWDQWDDILAWKMNVVLYK